MEAPAYPAFRELGNGLSRYRIDSDSVMVEVQRIGRRFAVHRLEATTYPERLRIHELLTLADSGVHPITAAEFDAWWTAAAP